MRENPQFAFQVSKRIEIIYLDFGHHLSPALINLETEQRTRFSVCCDSVAIRIAEPAEPIEDLAPRREVQRSQQRIKAAEHVNGGRDFMLIKENAKPTKGDEPAENRIAELLFGDAD